MFTVNEEKVIELVETLFEQIIEAFDKVKKHSEPTFYPDVELEQLRLIVNIFNLKLNVDGLVEEIEQLERENPFAIVSHFIGSKNLMNFLFWIREAKLWMYTDADKEFDFELFGASEDNQFVEENS